MTEPRRYPHTAQALRAFLQKKKATDLAALDTALGLSPGYFRSVTSACPRGRPSLAVLTQLSLHFGLKTLAPSLKKGYDADNAAVVKPSDAIDDSLPAAARWLRAARVKAGLTQAELSRRLQVPPTLTSRVERGVQHPSSELLQTASRALHAALPESLLRANATERYRARWGLDAVAASMPACNSTASQNAEAPHDCSASAAALRRFLEDTGLLSEDFVARRLGISKAELSQYLAKNACKRPSRALLMKLMALTGRSYLAPCIISGWLADEAPLPAPGTLPASALWLLKTRRENLFSVEELAHRLSITERRLAAFESGESSPSATLLEKVAADCKTTVPPDILFTSLQPVTLGAALKDARCAAGLSRRAMSEKSTLSIATIEQMELTDIPVTDDELKLFALACGLASIPKRWFYLRRSDMRRDITKKH